MKPGQASQTAVLVCMARAFAHGTAIVGVAKDGEGPERFDDPTALLLLPEEERQRVERFRSGAPPPGARGRFLKVFLEKRATMTVVRTIAIDQALSEAGAPQLVILGAGLDGRAFRMPELGQVTVFEVDHPDTQRDKRARAAQLKPSARDVRFVPVDFAHDSLDEALNAAGHDPERPTTWIWEGVVMYLTQPQIDATLAVVERRSAARSRLIVAYFAPAPMLWLVRPMVRRLGEPVRSVFTGEQMSALLAGRSFHVTEDQELPAIAAKLSPDLVTATRSFKHLRVVTADRR